MQKRWNQISAASDSRWTVATWLFLFGVAAVLGAGLWFVTGLGPAWLEFVGTSFKAVVYPMHGVRRSGNMRLFALFIATVALLIPVVIVLIPALAILLYVMKWANPTEHDDSDWR